MGLGMGMIAALIMLVASLFGVTSGNGVFGPLIVEVVVFFYVLVLGSLGAWFGGRGASRSEPSPTTDQG